MSNAIRCGASHKEIHETTVVTLALCGSVADWPARYVFKVLDDLESESVPEKE